eukprot:2958994-Lingulodinium_polyedra.AAC.1
MLDDVMRWRAVFQVPSPEQEPILSALMKGWVFLPEHPTLALSMEQPPSHRVTLDVCSVDKNAQ